MTTRPRVFRAAIVGTAESWRQTPWHDPSLYIASLNDAYLLGLPRADEWWEAHPLDKMVFRPKTKKVIRADEIPPGHYVRPEGHLEWLKAQAKAIPVWLQREPPDDWPAHAQRIPIEQLERKFGQYWASGPAYMVMSLYERGCRHLEIYGIHLATQAEYIKQRGNLEFLLGRLLGTDCELTKDDTTRLRTYRGREFTLVLPYDTPILQHGWKYAYEPEPEKVPSALDAEWRQLQQDKNILIARLVNWPVGQDKAQELERLKRLEVAETDVQHQIARLQTNMVLQVRATPQSPPLLVPVTVGG